MNGLEGWFNVATPILALLLLISSRRAINSYLAVYFLASSLGVLLLSELSLLSSLGSGYYFGYAAFGAMFVTVFCGNVAFSDRLENKKLSWIVAIVMYLIVAVNVGVYFESSPALWGIYSPIMLALECTLLSIGVLSSGILNGLFKALFLRRYISRYLDAGRLRNVIRGWAEARENNRSEAQ